jgi:ribose transport system permease protein
MTAAQLARARRIDWPPLLLALLVAALFALGSALSARFGTLDNAANILDQCALLGFVSLGQMLVVLTGGIDLSVAGVASLSAVLLAGTVEGHAELLWPMVAAVLALGGVIGCVNGLTAILLRVDPLIVTLGMDTMLAGGALLYRHQPGGSVPAYFQDLAFDHLAGVPLSALLLFALFGLAAAALAGTRTGRNLYAVGNDPAAAHLSGLPIRRTLVLAYAASGLLAALTGVYLVSRTGVGDPRAGLGLELASITPVVVGGTSLAGGRGSVAGTLLGVVLITLLDNLLNFLDVSSYYQWIVQGVIVIAAVSVPGARRRR